MVAALGHVPRSRDGTHRHEHVVLPQVLEARRQDADDGERRGIERERAAEHGRIAAHLRLPEPGAYDCDRRRIRLVVVVDQIASDDGRDAHGREEVAGHASRAETLRAIDAGERERLFTRQRERREGLRASAPVQIIHVTDRA